MDEFIEYLRSDKISNQELEEASIVLLFFDIAEDIKKEIRFNGRLEYLSSIKDEIRKKKESLDGIDSISSAYDLRIFSKKYKDFIKEIFKDYFKFSLDKVGLDSVVDLCFDYVSKKTMSKFMSGVVFAGFGASEMFPVVLSSVVDGKDERIFRSFEIKGGNDFNKTGPGDSAIIPFAQADVFYLFVEGIANQYLPFLESILRNILRDKSESIVKDYIADPDERIVENHRQEKDNEVIVDRIMSEFHSYRQEKRVQPLVRLLSSVPKEEMATMAEALVELTSLRGKLESHVESVSGPIDVVVVSKGDGVVWIKRKHYFDIDINQDFNYRKARMVTRGVKHDEKPT